MKNPLLTAAAVLAFGFGATAQTTAPDVSTVAPGQESTNPDMSEQPAVDAGTPDMDLPGMTTKTVGSTEDVETAPLTEGFDAGAAVDEPYVAPAENIDMPATTVDGATDDMTVDGEDEGMTIGDELDELPLVGDDTDDDSAPSANMDAEAPEDNGDDEGLSGDGPDPKR